MDADDRAGFAKRFERIAEKIQDLAYELTDNKDLKEFLEEMETHNKDFEDQIGTFKKASMK